MSLNFWRWTLALLIILPFSFRDVWSRVPELLPHWRYLLLQGLLSVAIFNSLQYLAAHSTSAINLNLVNSTNPVFTFLLSWILLRQMASGLQVVGLLIAMAGLAVTVSGGSLTNLTSLTFNIGDLWMLLAVIAWALYSVMLRRSPIKLPPFTLLTVLIMMGLLVQLPVYLLEFSIVGGFELSKGNLIALGYVSVFPSLLAFYFWIKGVEVLGANVSSMFLYLAPPIAAVMAWFFLGERLGWHHLVGEVLIVIGFFLTVMLPTFQARKRKKATVTSP